MKKNNDIRNITSNVSGGSSNGRIENLSIIASLTKSKKSDLTKFKKSDLV